MKMPYPLFAGLGFRCCVSQAFIISILVGVLSCVDDISTWFVVASLSLNSQVLLSVHWLARARVFGLKDYGIYGTKPGRNLRVMWGCHGLRIGKPIPSHCFSFLICPASPGVPRATQCLVQVYQCPLLKYSVNFTTSGHAIKIPI